MRKSPWLQKSIPLVIGVAFVGTMFLVWGAGGIFNSTQGSQTVAAKVGAETITIDQYERFYQRLSDYYKQKMGKFYSPDFAKTLGLDRKALDILVENELWYLDAKKAGFVASKKEVQDTVINNSAFSKNGRFNIDYYKYMLRANNYTPAEFEDEIRRELITDRYKEFLVDSIKVDDAAVKDRYLENNTKFDLDYVYFNTKAREKSIKISDADIAAYYKANPGQFTRPAQVQLSLIAVDADIYRNAMRPDDAELKAFYDAHKQQYKTDDQIWARHILFKLDKDADKKTKEAVRKKAEAVLTIARSRQVPFDRLAKQYSEEPGAEKTGGDLGYFGRGKMVKPFEDAAFKMKKGEISDLVTTQFGYHIIYIENIKPAGIPALELIRERVIADYRTAYAASGFDRLLKESSTTEPNHLFDQLVTLGLAPVDTGMIAAATVIKNVDKDDSTKIIGDALAKGSVGYFGAYATKYHLYCYKVVKLDKAGQKTSLADATASIRDRLSHEFAISQTKKAAAQISSEAVAGASIETLAKKYNLIFEHSGTLAFTDKDSKALGPVDQFKQALSYFIHTSKTVFPTAIKANDGYYVLMVRTMKTPSDQDYEKAKDGARKDALEAKQMKFFEDYKVQLEKTYGPVVRNESIFKKS